MPTAREYQSRITALHWDDLRELWHAIQRGELPDWEPGKAFEYLVLRAFVLNGAEVTWPFRVPLHGAEVEQIDGAVYAAGLCCLVESKDDTRSVGIEPLAKLRNQLLRRPVGTLGLIFSRTRFTSAAIQLAAFATSQPILLWNGDELQYGLEQERMSELLILKYRACVEYGIPDYDARERIAK